MVVSNTSPLNYLVHIHAAHLLPALYGQIHIPADVAEELRDSAAPPSVRAWIASPPDWLVIHSEPTLIPPEWTHIHRGEAAAIMLALEAKGTLLLIDDLDGREVARRAGVTIMGTLGILDAAAMKRLADFRTLLAALQATNFRTSRKLVDALLLRHPEMKDQG